MGINESGINDEMLNSYVQALVPVTNVAIEAKVGANKLEGRQMLRIYNGSNSTVYMGPSGVTVATGEPIVKNQSISITVSDAVGVYLIAASGSNDVLVSEWA